MKKFKKPWGFYQIIWEKEHAKAKIITVKPLQRTSLQIHYKRDEFWMLLSGRAELNKSVDTIITDVPGDEFIVRKGQSHYIKNRSTKYDLKIFELQVGICDENDIIRLEDKYGRIKSIKELKKESKI